MSVQTSYSEAPVTARKGQLYDGNHEIESARATDAQVPGNLVLLSGLAAGALDAHDSTALSALAVDVDAILTSAAAATTKQIVTSLTGVIAGAIMHPARRITATLNNNANWDTSEIKISGEGWDGAPISETLLVPDGGNVTLTTSQFFRRVVSVEVDPQTSTAATYEVGVSADEGIYDPARVGILIRDTSREPLSSSDAVAADDRVDVLTAGKIYVATEATITSPGPAYLRTATSGSDIMGQWRGSAATGFTVQPWAEFVTTDDAGTVKIAVLRKKF
jgi:hypothetical protein